jgi:DNA-binding IclR family transcriptional regulator
MADWREEGSGMAAEQSPGGVRSVARALDILALVGDQPTGVTLRDAVAATGLPKTTVLRLLQSLEAHGLIWNVGSQAYVAGPALLHLAGAASEAWQLRPDVAAMLEDLAENSHETVNLWVRRALTRVCVAQAHANQSLRHVIRIGDERSLDSGAAARVLITAVSDDALADIAALSPQGPDHLATLRRWVRETEEAGYSVSHGEREEGLSALSVPVRSARGSTVAALTIAGPTTRFTPERLEVFLRGLRGCADEIGRRGFGPSQWKP